MMTSVCTNINNNEASSRGSMPLKDNVSDGSNTFILYRHRHARVPPITHQTTMTTSEIRQKRWYGNSGSRDSTAISGKRNTLEVGLVTKNANITSHSSKNDVNQAKSRVRNRGYIVPR